jgi:UDP-N-acetylglucosamine--N-acetylmuramyl-(pentapeptide) pyrophosphoryl-undecaprenol N-acetylglucosamine transferase
VSAEERPVLIMAGGTGGHIFPGIAVAHELSARGVPVAWLGSAQGLENTLVPAAGIALERVGVAGVRGKGVATLLLAPLRLARAVRDASRIVRRLQPRSALALGGFAAGPGGLAARLTRVPLLVHEQNRVPGYTNRVLARFARRVLAGFPDAFAPARHAEHVGNPVRAEIAALAEPARRFAGREGPLRLLVLGGSQGARALNRALPEALAGLRGRVPVQVRHQAGRSGLDAALAEYERHTLVARVEPFIDDMAAAYAWADLVVCRAGALTLAELCAAGVGSVLVPYPHAVDDHQTRNAEYLRQAGAAVLEAEGPTLAERLVVQLEALASDPERRRAMAHAARALARPQAAARIADACLEEARR